MAAASLSSTPSFDAAVVAFGREVSARIPAQPTGIFNRDYWHGTLMDWVLRDPDFKVDLFRFVDVLPSLKTTDAVREHVREMLLRPNRSLPLALSTALKAAASGLTAGMAAATLRKNVSAMAEQFIIGATPEEVLPSLRELHGQGLGFTVDLLGETTLSNVEGERYVARYEALIAALGAECATWPAAELLDTNHRIGIPRANVSLKLSALEPHLDPVDHAGSVARLKHRVLPLLRQAKAAGVFVNFDLEQWALHDITYDLFDELASDPEFRSWPHLGVVVQAYLRSSDRDVERLLHVARRRGTPITIRLVKGAYWDFEVIRARQNDWPCPVFLHKAESDVRYEVLSRTLLDSIDHLWPAFGSHNLRSLLHALVYAKQRGIPPLAFELQSLFGMADGERHALRSLGYRSRVYAPVGELLPGMAYLVRRLLENTANSGFLKQREHDAVDLERLLAPPAPPPAAASGALVRAKTAPAKSQRDALPAPLGPFENAPPLDFTATQVRDDFQRALNDVASRLPLRVTPVISGKPRKTKSLHERVNPSATTQKVAEISYGDEAMVNEAVDAAWKAWPAWRGQTLEHRATLLEKLADRLEQDRYRLAALQCFEVGKPWAEADADVAEAIDFCRYYARQAFVELGPTPMLSHPGEDNRLVYEGAGPTAVIAPWNFPLAILCGMTVAALVAGNPVVVKPAEQSSAIAAAFFEHVRAVGFPPDVAHFLPGDGAVVGAALVAHPRVAVLAFTGSEAVGLGLLKTAAHMQPGQRSIKKVICEMGGKNAIIVDEDADLDEAVAGVMRSAYGFAGQKCSACSRVIVVGGVYDEFVQRLVAATATLQLGAATLPSTQVGPVVDAEAHQRLCTELKTADASLKRLFVGAAPEGGWFVPPAIYEVDRSDHRWMQEEFFGPLLAVIRAGTFDTALSIANSTRFALTGAVYSRLPSHLEAARREFRVGNLYLNRGSTGALVARQPFGGFDHSGGGSKAGGPGYLLHFVHPRCVTENTSRRGFAPQLGDDILVESAHRWPDGHVDSIVAPDAFARPAQT